MTFKNILLFTLCFNSLIVLQAKANPCHDTFTDNPQNIETLNNRTEVENFKNFLGDLVEQVSETKTSVDISECGVNCFQFNSDLTDQTRIIKLDSNVDFPIQEKSVLTVPEFSQIDSHMMRRLLIGHELHPYILNSAQKVSLRSSQKMAIEDFKESLNRAYQSFLHVAPTATGKSWVLVKNLIEVMKRNPQKKISFITVDKIKPVGQLHFELKFELQATNFNLHSIQWKVEEKKDFVELIRQVISAEQPTVINLTLKSLQTQMAKLKNKDLALYNRLFESLSGIFIDEVHHLGGAKTLPFILDLKNKSKAFLYGTTATPVHKDVEIQKLFEKMHWSYLEEKNLDKYPASMVVDQLINSIERGDITPFNDVHFLLDEIIMDKSNIPLFIQKHENYFFSINPYYYDKITKILQGLFESNKKGMIIVSTIEEADALADFLNKEVKNIHFESYHSNMALESREKVLQNSFREEAHYILAVRALDEGVNLPHLSAYIDLNPAVSIKQMVHRIGRVLRPSLNKLSVDIFILSSYRNFEDTKTLIDSVTHFKEGVKEASKSKGTVSPARKFLKNLSDRTNDLFIQRKQFWESASRKSKSSNKEKSALDHYFYYLSQMRKQFPRLSSQENYALISQFKKTGDIELRNKIVSHNLGLVAYVVKKYLWAVSPVVDVMDLVQVGNEALMKALVNYEPLDYQFSTYAGSYIDGYIKSFIFNQAHLVGIKSNPSSSLIFWNLDKEKKSQGEGSFNYNLAAKNISTENIQVTPQQVGGVDNHLQPAISFNQTIIDPEFSKRHAEEIPKSEEIYSFEEYFPLKQDHNSLIFSAEETKIIIQLFQDLLSKESFLFTSQRNRNIKSQRNRNIFIQIVFMKKSQRQIAEEFNISVQAVRAILKSFEGKLRNFGEGYRLRRELDTISLPNNQKLGSFFFSAFFDLQKTRSFFDIVNIHTESIFGKSFIEFIYTETQIKNIKKGEEI